MADGAFDFQRDDGIATFVIRIRQEGAGGEDDGGWVAHVIDVLEHTERYVRDLDDLMGFIEEHLRRMGITPRRQGGTGVGRR